MAIEYKASNGARLSDKEAAIYGSRITHLSEKKGYVTPKMVVDDARNPNSPLHNYFDWDDKEAAEKWRIEQAQYLIRHIVVTVMDEKKPEIRHFYSITPTSDMGKIKESKVYVTLNTIMSDTEKRAEVIAYALRELNGWMERYRQYSELESLIKTMEIQVKKVKVKRHA